MIEEKKKIRGILIVSIPTKGARKITVDRQVFLWLIRRKVTYGQECYPGGHLHVAVQDITKEGSTLVVETDRFHPKGLITANPYCEGKDTPVTPSDVELWIKQAIELGWQPQKLGKTFQVQVKESKLQFAS